MMFEYSNTIIESEADYNNSSLMVNPLGLCRAEEIVFSDLIYENSIIKNLLNDLNEYMSNPFKSIDLTNAEKYSDLSFLNY